MKENIGNIPDICYKLSDEEYHFASSKNISFAVEEEDKTKIVFVDGKVIFTDRPLIYLISHFYGNGYLFINKYLWLKPSNIASLLQEDSTNILVMKNQVTIELLQKDVEELLFLLKNNR